jgi:hypothetical protein
MLGLGILSAGCDGSHNTTGDRTVTDSAGIEIVTIVLPSEAVAEQSVVGAEPVLSIGVVSGRESQELSDVMGAIRLQDGRIVVGNGGTNQLRFFDSGGSFLSSVGGDGEGPGEFRSIDFIDLIGRDTIIAYDGRLLRVSLFSETGEFLTSHGPINSPEMLLPRIVGVLATRDFVCWSNVEYEPDGVGVHSAPFRFGVSGLLNGNYREVGTGRSGEEAQVMYRGRMARAFRPFGRESDVAAGGHHVYVLTSTDDAGVRVYDTAGRLVRIFRVDIVRQPADEAAVALWADSWIARYAGGSAEVEEWWRHGFRETPPPEYVPVFRSLEVDSDGNVCAERYPLTMDDETLYWCFSPEGHFRRAIRLPRRLLREGPHPHFDPQLGIGNDLVIGVWQDENDVQYVRMYTLP